MLVPIPARWCQSKSMFLHFKAGCSIHQRSDCNKTWLGHDWWVMRWFPASNRNTGWWFQTFLELSIIYGIILPIDELIFFRGVEATNQYWLVLTTVMAICRVITCYNYWTKPIYRMYIPVGSYWLLPRKSSGFCGENPAVFPSGRLWSFSWSCHDETLHDILGILQCGAPKCDVCWFLLNPWIL